jgi:uncharacterized protein YceK
MKKKISVALLSSTFLLLCGCASIFNAPPGHESSGASVRSDSDSRNPWIEARASQLESKGLSAREAKGQAITEAALRGR